MSMQHWWNDTDNRPSSTLSTDLTWGIWASAVRGRRITTRRGPKLISVTCTVSVRTSGRTQYASIRKTSRCILHREAMV